MMWRRDRYSTVCPLWRRRRGWRLGLWKLVVLWEYGGSWKGRLRGQTWSCGTHMGWLKYVGCMSSTVRAGLHCSRPNRCDGVCVRTLLRIRARRCYVVNQSDRGKSHSITHQCLSLLHDTRCSYVWSYVRQRHTVAWQCQRATVRSAMPKDLESINCTCTCIMYMHMYGATYVCSRSATGDRCRGSHGRGGLDCTCGLFTGYGM